MPYDPTYHLLWRPDKVRAIVERERPDVLEIHSPYVAALGALSTPRDYFKIRTFTWHSDFIDTYGRVLFPHEWSAETVEQLTKPLWGMVRAIAKRCDATFAAAKWQVAKLERHGVERVIHMPFGIDKTVFNASARSAEMRAWLIRGDGAAPESADSETLVCVAVGRFAIEKQWSVVIDAFRELTSGPAVLVMFGDGPERARLEEMAADIPGVRFVGFERDRKKLASALASADVLVHSCPFETFGLSIAEAIACGLPVVVPNEGGAYESAPPTCSEYFAPGDSDGCAEAIGRIFRRDRATLRAAALEAATGIATIDASFDNLIRTYDELIAAR